jgi:hypothetical protein
VTAARRRIFIDGHVALSPAEEDGSLSIPVDSAEALAERIADAQRRKLGQMIDAFQSEADDASAHRQWKEIEKTVFGVEYPD